MSVAAAPIATDSHDYAAAVDKEAMVQFWRSGLEYIARAITAHHNIIRGTRICDTYSRRASPGGSPAPSLDPQIASHRETLETCILALAELAASGLTQSSLSHRTQSPSSLETRVTTLENQMKALQATTQPLAAKLKTLDSNLTRVHSRIQVCEAKVNTGVACSDKSHQELESRVAGPSAQATNPPLTQAFQDDFKTLKERLTAAEARIAAVESTRTRVDTHGTKLALMEGKIGVLQKDFGETRTRLTAVVPLAQEAKAVLSGRAKIQQTEQDLQNLKGQQEAADTRFNSLESALQVLEQKLEETNKKNSTLSESLVTDLSELSPLKQHVSSLIKLPTTMDQLQASVAALGPLKLWSQEITAMATQAPQLLGLISHNERVQDDITQIRSKLVRCNKEIADAKKETAESVHLLGEEVTTLSSKNQTMQGEISATASQVARLELSVKRAEELSQEVSERMGGIDARFKANQVTAQWAQEQIRTMRADITYLEPLKAAREALLLLSGRTEELMPLSIELSSAEFQKISKKGERGGTIMAVARTPNPDMVAAYKDVQQRLSRVEPHVAQLESDVSSTLEKLTELRRTSNMTELQVKDARELLQKFQNDVTPLLKFKADILELVNLVPHCSSLFPLVGQVQALQQIHANDITPMKGEVRKIKSIFTSMATLRTDMEDTKGKIASLPTLQQQFQVYQDSLGKLEQRVAKLESEASGSNGPLAIRIPTANRTGGFSLSQSLGAGSSSSGTTRWKAPMYSTPRKSFGVSQHPQSEPPTTPPPALSQTQSPHLPGRGGLTNLAEVADELVALIDKYSQTEMEIANLSRSLNKSNKQLGELGDSVHGLDQLMTTVQRTSDDNQVALKLLERGFQNMKEGNAAQLKEIDLKHAHTTVLKDEFQSLKLDVDVRLKVMETIAHELDPLKEHAETLIALAQPVFSPTSPVPHASAALPESRLVALERSSKSAVKELINLNGWVMKTQGDIRSCKNLSNEVQALEGRVRELADSIQTKKPLATSLTERASDSVAPLERPSDQLIQVTREQLERVAGAATRIETLEEQMHALQKSQPKLEESLEKVASQVGELVPTINKVVKPFTDHVNSILSLVPLSNHVPSLVPLIDRVPQLHASIQSLLDRVDAAASIAAAAQTPVDPGPASQLRSPVTDRGASPEQPAAADNTALFVSATSESRPNKRRRMEEVIDSFETQLDSIRGELDGVVDDVKTMCAERGEGKKICTNAAEERQLAGAQPFDSGEIADSLKRIQEDLDTVMDQLRSLFEGEAVWPERIDIALGRRWAQAFQPPELRPGAAASAMIVKLCNELEVLKMAVEAHGSGTPAPPSMIDAVHITWAENLTEKVLANVNKEQAQFRTELEELISKALQPVKKVFKVFKESPDIDV
ncbi:hypothetical protein OPQ81_004488 [Rhizoctonia solani]|nr:hypothetical protein OPQ81_004488 [Rhizoctonia solani]